MCDDLCASRNLVHHHNLRKAYKLCLFATHHRQAVTTALYAFWHLHGNAHGGEHAGHVERLGCVILKLHAQLVAILEACAEELVCAAWLHSKSVAILHVLNECGTGVVLIAFHILPQLFNVIVCEHGVIDTCQHDVATPSKLCRRTRVAAHAEPL